MAAEFALNLEAVAVAVAATAVVTVVATSAATQWRGASVHCGRCPAWRRRRRRRWPVSSSRCRMGRRWRPAWPWMRTRSAARSCLRGLVWSSARDGRRWGPWSARWTDKAAIIRWSLAGASVAAWAKTAVIGHTTCARKAAGATRRSARAPAGSATVTWMAGHGAPAPSQAAPSRPSERLLSYARPVRRAQRRVVQRVAHQAVRRQVRADRTRRQRRRRSLRSQRGRRRQRGRAAPRRGRRNRGAVAMGKLDVLEMGEGRMVGAEKARRR